MGQGEGTGDQDPRVRTDPMPPDVPARMPLMPKASVSDESIASVHEALDAARALPFETNDPNPPPFDGYWQAGLKHLLAGLYMPGKLLAPNVLRARALATIVPKLPTAERPAVMEEVAV